MKKNKHYFLRIAILRTLIFAFTLFLAPLVSPIYRKLIGEEVYNHTFGYPIAGTAVLILMSLILTVRSYALAFDKSLRKEYLEEE